MALGFGKKQPPTDPVSLAQAQQLREQQEVQAAFQKGVTALRDFIAPSSIEFQSNYFRIGGGTACAGSKPGVAPAPGKPLTGWLFGSISIFIPTL